MKLHAVVVAPRVRLLLVAGVGLLAGGALVWLHSSASPPPHRPRALDEVLTAARRGAPEPALERVCAPRASRGLVARHSTYDFEGDVVEPGLSVAVRPARFDPGLPREARDLDEVIDERRELLRQCYRWARFYDASLGEAQVVVGLEADEWGSVEPFTITITDTETLSLCVWDVLQGMALDRYAPRRTRTQLKIELKPSGQSRPRRAPDRPAPPRTTSLVPAGTCVTQPTPAQIPHDFPSLAPVSVSDFDQQQADEELPRGRRVPRVRIGKAVVMGHIGKDMIRRAVRLHLPQVQACLGEGARRRPGLAGTVTMGVLFSQTGEASQTVVRSSTLGDPKVEQCVTRVFAQLRLPPRRWSEGTVLVTYPITLHASDAGGLEESAAPAVTPAQGTAQTDECAHAGLLLQAALRDAPWADGRALDAARAMTRLARDPRHDRCVDDAARLILETGAVAHRTAHQLRQRGYFERAVERYRVALALRPDDVNTRFFLGEALWELERFAEAVPEYLRVVGLEPGSKLAGEAAWAALLAAGKVSDRSH